MNVVSDGVADVKDLLSSMEKESEHIQYKNSLFSLVKDLVNIIYVTKSGELSNIEFIKKIMELTNKKAIKNGTRIKSFKYFVPALTEAFQAKKNGVDISQGAEKKEQPKAKQNRFVNYKQI